ncbi:MAG: bifunctional DNA primase/polymerase [Pseudomonadota bacterium]
MRQAVKPSATDPVGELFAAGYSLVPLGGDDGKSPLVKFASASRLPLSLVQRRMADMGSQSFAIRTEGLVVIDCDSDNEATRRYIKDHFGIERWDVKTPRGGHTYFRHAGGQVPTAVRLPSIAIDFKAGPNSYVAAPGSIRPDGGRYEGQLPRASELPVFPTIQARSKQGLSPTHQNKVPIGGRTTSLWQRAREYVETVDSEAQLFDELRCFADQNFEDADAYSDGEIAKSAKWAWQKRLSNSLWSGANSAVTISIAEYETLMGVTDGTLGLALLVTLRHNHSVRSQQGKPFCIAREAMAEADVIAGWSTAKYQRATAALLKASLIRRVRSGNQFRGASLFQFGRLHQ